MNIIVNLRGGRQEFPFILVEVLHFNLQSQIFFSALGNVVVELEPQYILTRIYHSRFRSETPRGFRLSMLDWTPIGYIHWLELSAALEFHASWDSPFSALQEV